MKFCVYTRSFYENPYLDAFIEHYCNLGFDKIIILKADGTLNTCPKEFASKVEFYDVANEVNGLIPKYDKLVLKSTYDWILSCDIDEFLLLNKKYKNIHDYVESITKLNPNINGFYFRWGMIEKYSNDKPNACLSDLLQNYKVYKNIHIKTMMKRDCVQTIHDPHICRFKGTGPAVYFEKKVLSIASALHAITDNSYDDSVLIHVHTRSLHNIVLKAFNTGLQNKTISNQQKFADSLKVTHSTSPDGLLKLFKEAIGKKATLPFAHSKTDTIDLSSFHIPQKTKPIINVNEETKELLKTLENRKINRLEYLGFINKLNECTRKLFIK